MTVYVVFKSHVFEPENEVYFAYSLEDAFALLDEKTEQSDFEWEMAEVFPSDSWLFKLAKWLFLRSR